MPPDFAVDDSLDLEVLPWNWSAALVEEDVKGQIPLREQSARVSAERPAKPNMASV